MLTEPMMDDDQSQLEQLERLFRLEGDQTDLWHRDELAAIWRHLLSASPAAALRSTDAAAGSDLAAPPLPAGPCTGSFQELFQQSEPNIAWLELTKRFAKAAAGDGRLPREVAAVLYLAAIAAAWLHGDCRITDLENDALGNKVAWALSQPWLGKDVGQLLRAWLDETVRICSSGCPPGSP